MALQPTDDLPHPGSGVEEWVFTAWRDDGSCGIVSGHRLLGRNAWYWAALVERGRPLLHVTEWDVAVRSDPFIVKAPEMWAEHHCDAPMEQWSIGNEAHAAALDDAGEALGRGYGVPTPMAFDLEWYATAAAGPVAHGYEQAGVVHGLVEILHRPDVTFEEAPAWRWHRWVDDRDRAAALPPLTVDEVVAHTGLRTAFAFPDGTVSDWVLTPTGWRSRPPPTAMSR
jgi:hypothetical protein